MYIRYRRNIFTEPLPSKDRGGRYRHTDICEGFIKYAVELGLGTKFHKDRFRHSKLIGGTHRHIHSMMI
jgi:hypothetical protein